MCGILFCNFTVQNLSNIIKYLKNRGPDYTGDEVYQNHHFIHVLLSMTGEQYTCQPFIYPDQEIAILFNGEIYNYLDYGDFNSDGECLIHVYQQYGEKFIQKLDGEFAVVLCDFKQDLLYYSTDVFGIKPLWLARDQAKIAISSYESPLERLGFQHRDQLPANVTYQCRLSTHQVLQEIPVYQFDLRQHKTSYDDWNRSFEEAIRKRCQNIKHQIFIGLSSGYDSGAIACALNKLKIPYSAYSIVGSENPDIIKRRQATCPDPITIQLTRQEFSDQYQYLLENCERYNLFIDNDEAKNLAIWRNKLQTAQPSERSIIQGKINNFHKALVKAQNKKLVEDNGAIGLGCICSRARPKGQLIYLTGSGADEICSDYGWKGIRHYRHSTIGGLFPEDLASVFPWRNFFGNTQRAYLMKEEYIAGTYGIEGRYPFLDKQLVQEFLWLSAELKNNNYKAPIYQYLATHQYPLDLNQKMGFNCGFSYVHRDKGKIKPQIATRTKIGETKDKSLIVDTKLL